MPDVFFTEGEKPRVTREKRIEEALKGAEKDSDLLTEEVEKKGCFIGRTQKELSEAKSGRVGRLLFYGVPPTVIIGGIIYGAHELLKKKLPQSFLSKPEVVEPQTYEQQQDTQISTLRCDVSTGAISLPELTNPAFIKDNNVIQLTAWAGGPNALFSTIDPSIAEITPKFSETVFSAITTQLNLDSIQQQWLRSNWDALTNDPALAMKLLNGTQFPGHQADPAVIKFYQCTIDVYNKDLDKTTWQDRVPDVQACSVQANQTPEGKPPGNPSMVPVETQLQNQTMAITSRIFKEGVRAEAEVIQAFVRPAMEIAQGLVVNHRLPDRDDVQGWFNTAIEAGDQLVGHIRELPREVRQIVDQQIHHWSEARNNHVDNIPSDYIFQSPAEAINHLTGGGGLPMTIILGIELGLAAINAGLYIKRSAEMRNIKLPSREEMKQGAIKEELKYEKKLKRGIPEGYIRAGLLISPGLFGIGGKVIDETTGRLSDEVVAEVIMNAEDIRLEKETYKRLIELLKSGVGEEAIREIASRKLLIKGEQLVTPIIKAEDLLRINFEVISKGQNKGRVCRGEPDWYD